jgi:tRNA-specific 2-thiouridylase
MADAGGSFAESLRVRYGAVAVPGEIRERGGRTLGTHSGIHRFTIGQRRGLGVAAGRPVRVCTIDPETRVVEVTADPQALLSTSCAAEDCRWLDTPPPPGTRLAAQIRYQQRAVPAVVEHLEPGGGGIRVRFETPVAAVTSGQSLVLYAGDRVLGGGLLTRD